MLDYTNYALFKDDQDGDGIVIDPRSTLRMSMERAKVPWRLRFNRSIRAIQLTMRGYRKFLAEYEVSKVLTKIGIRLSHQSFLFDFC